MSRTIHGMHILTLGACALGTVAKIIKVGHHRFAQLTGELSTDEAEDNGFFSTLRVDLCIFGCHTMCINFCGRLL